jgi:hypothetical protein
MRAVEHYVAGFDDDHVITSYKRILRLSAGNEGGCDYNHLGQYWQPDPTREIRFDCDADEKAFVKSTMKPVAVFSAFLVGLSLAGRLGSDVRYSLKTIIIQIISKKNPKNT